MRFTESLIFPGNKATDQNEFDTCEEYEPPEPNCCRNAFDPTCTCMSETVINADFANLKNFKMQYRISSFKRRGIYLILGAAFVGGRRLLEGGVYKKATFI